MIRRQLSVESVAIRAGHYDLITLQPLNLTKECARAISRRPPEYLGKSSTDASGAVKDIYSESHEPVTILSFEYTELIT